jgi:hypothetical protein
MTSLKSTLPDIAKKDKNIQYNRLFTFPLFCYNLVLSICPHCIYPPKTDTVTPLCHGKGKTWRTEGETFEIRYLAPRESGGENDET